MALPPSKETTPEPTAPENPAVEPAKIPEPTLPAKEAVAEQPVLPPAEISYNELAVKAITGTKNRRLALINNVTFSAGEEAMVKFKDAKVKVRCLEIKESSVIITLEGKDEKQELFLANIPSKK